MARLNVLDWCAEPGRTRSEISEKARELYAAAFTAEMQDDDDAEARRLKTEADYLNLAALNFDLMHPHA